MGRVMRGQLCSREHIDEAARAMHAQRLAPLQAAQAHGGRMLVAYISRFLRLDPGDVITTGTPPGVGMGRKPPEFLRAGDLMRLSVEGLGEQRCRVSAG